jgi:hypothetical protein
MIHNLTLGDIALYLSAWLLLSLITALIMGRFMRVGSDADYPADQFPHQFPDGLGTADTTAGIGIGFERIGMEQSVHSQEAF